jgi:hypothetical protein
MEQNINNATKQNDTKKLTLVVVFLSLFVFVLYGLAPLV